MILAPGQKLRFLGRHATDHCNEAEIELLNANRGGSPSCKRKGNTLEITRTVKLKVDRNGVAPFEIVEPNGEAV